MSSLSIVDDDGKLYQRYKNKCINAEKEGLSCDLTYEEFCQLVCDAGLVSSKLGFTGEKYVLARYNDSGNYTVDNCRFITQKENVAERRISEKSRTTSRENVKKAYAALKDLSSEELSRQIKSSPKWQEYSTKREEEKKRNCIARLANMDHRYVGEHNSQFGSFWITDGVMNKKWKEEYGMIPDGWYRGRVINY